MNIHEFYIKRCIEIAKKGLGSTRPNPMVGCVIVYKNSIIGEGYTSEYGGHHAEVNAINSVKDKSLLKDSILYVTLEPCSHHGKTPPCSDFIVKNQIPDVMIGCMDDNVLVAGKGIKKLKSANCNVTLGILENECKIHHKRFFTFHNKKRPYIILKWAETRDGYIAPKSRNENKPVWITNSISRQLVHKWRTEEHSILVGTNTVLADNPRLTSRNWQGKNPIRIVIDKNNKLNRDYNIFNCEADTIILNNDLIDFKLPLVEQICNVLYHKNITSVIIEGGSKTLQTFIDANIWDEARLFVGPLIFKNGIKAPKLNGHLIKEQKIIDDTLNIYLND